MTGLYVYFMSTSHQVRNYTNETVHVYTIEGCGKQCGESLIELAACIARSPVLHID